jgi:hypothetical protein
LWSRPKISTLTLPGHDSGGLLEGQEDEGEEDSEESSGEKEAGKEEEKVGSTGGAFLRLAGMMRLRRAVGVILLLSSGTAAHAVSITNRDDHDHKLTVMEGSEMADHVLKPSQSLNDICAKGCTIRLDDIEDDEYQLEANDVVSIEDGTLFYDGPDTAAAQFPADGTKPAGRQ